MSKTRPSGFTLIEMLIVIAIIAILGAIAYPSYSRFVERGRRTDATNLVLRIASEQEKFYTQFNRYALDLTAAPPAGLGLTALLSENRYYRIAVAAGPTGDDQTYVLTATPQNAQAIDKCANLTLSNAGAKGHSGNESNGRCW